MIHDKNYNQEISLLICKGVSGNKTNIIFQDLVSILFVK